MMCLRLLSLFKDEAKASRFLGAAMLYFSSRSLHVDVFTITKAHAHPNYFALWSEYIDIHTYFCSHYDIHFVIIV